MKKSFVDQDDSGSELKFLDNLSDDVDQIQMQKKDQQKKK